MNPRTKKSMAEKKEPASNQEPEKKQKKLLNCLVEENALNSTTKKGKVEKAEPAPNQEPEKKQKKLFDQIIFRVWCKSCGLCAAFCPQKVIGLDETGSPVIEKPGACIGCRFCELHCPDFAITIKERENDSRRNAA